VYPVLVAAGAELIELKPAGVIALIFGARVIALLALGACQVDDYPVLFLCHFLLPLNPQVRGLAKALITQMAAQLHSFAATRVILYVLPRTYPASLFTR
jgi:hypothetical protein